jgi:phosphatidylserine/phosphatidylglycerophosphate/cardiolipin synthase-like enzyme
VPQLGYELTPQEGIMPMRTSRIASVFVGFVLIAALAGCGTSTTSAPPAANSYTLVQEPQQGYQPVYNFISSAKHTLDMTMYALADPQADAALIADAKRGVQVRVLLDGDNTDGGGATLDQAAFSDLKANGVQVRFAWPGVLWHQKSIVVDQTKVAIMTTNLAAAYYPAIRGFIVITNNPATVSGVGTTFETDFNNTKSPPSQGVVPAGSELIWSPGAQNGLIKLIGSARPGTTLYTENEQFSSPAIAQAFVAAAKRGVMVNVAMTYSSSYASIFDTLVAGGVHVNLYYGNTPLYIQSKALSVNGNTVYVGSINYVGSSMNADRNVGIITTNPTVVKGITATMASDFAGATPYSKSG